MENVATDENWKTCFSQLAPGLLLFARQWARSSADAEDIVQEAFVEVEDESQRALVAALDLLPNEQREVLVMKIWNELTFAEIASALEISQNTAASRYRYALAALKKNLPSV